MGERRLAAIMFTDIVGYTAMMAADEMLALRAIERHGEILRPLVEKHNGVWLKEMGDGTLSSFSSTIEAIHCATEIQTKLKDEPDFDIRIGIHLGDVVFTGTDVYGDGVNVASRIEPTAVPGGIAISGQVYDTIISARSIAAEYLGEKTFKNVTRPIKIYSISSSDLPTADAFSDLRATTGEGIHSTDSQSEIGLKDASKTTSFQSDDALPRQKHRQFRGGAAVTIVAACVLVVVFSVVYINTRNTPAPISTQLNANDERKSIVVLPLINLSADAEQEFFADGISEELMTVLARNQNLEVVSRSSAFWFKGKDRNIPAVVERLGVEYVLEGSVRKALDSDDIRVSVTLIDAKLDSVLWSESFDRELVNVFALQDEIASNIMSRMNVSLSDATPEVPAIDPEAYLLYLQARYFLGQANPLQARGLLEAAVEIDPNYGRAWMSLSRTYLQLLASGKMSLEEKLRLSDYAVQKALEIGNDDSIAFSHLGWQAIYDERDFEKSARYFEQALALDPTNVDILRGLVSVAINFGKYDDALIIAEYVVQHDPLCTICIGNLVTAYMVVGEFEKAESTARSLLLFDSGGTNRNETLAITLLLAGKPEMALATFELAQPPSLAGIAMAQYSAGLQREFEDSLDELIERFPDDDFQIARTHAWGGDIDRAFVRLASAIESGRIDNNTWNHDPLLANLTMDPRWLSLLESVGRSQERLDEIGFEIALPK